MIIYRKDAIALGLKRYYTGRPCKHGHICERHVIGGVCIRCKRIATEQWHKETRSERNKVYYKWAKANPDKIRQAKASYRSSNKDKIRMEFAAWKAANPHQAAARSALRRARLANASVGLGKEEKIKINEIYRQCALMTRLTGVQYHVDHIIAISRGGKHHPDNLQLLTAIENMKKHAR